MSLVVGCWLLAVGYCWLLLLVLYWWWCWCCVGVGVFFFSFGGEESLCTVSFFFGMGGVCLEWGFYCQSATVSFRQLPNVLAPTLP